MIDHTIFNWIQLVKKDASIPSVAKHLCHYLSTFMNMEQNVAWPSLKRIQHETGLAHSTVAKYLKWLDDHGWLERESGNSIKTTRYLTTIPNKTVAKIVEQGSPSGGLRSPSGGLGVVRQADTNNTSINKPMNNMRKSAICFTDFWKAWPNKKDKKRAEKAWNRLSLAKQKQAMEDFPSRYADTDKRFIPLPTTYIHGERWEDERPSISKPAYGKGGI